MVVNSISFWLFFSIVVFLYYALFRQSNKWQNYVLLISSYVFYGMVDWGMCILLLVTTCVFYYFGKAIFRSKGQKQRKSLVTLSVVVGIGVLFYFKYFNFFIGQFSLLLQMMGLRTNNNSFDFIVPLGISFFTFKLIAYTIEVYRNKMKPCLDPITFGVYISYFPTIMSGPIDNPSVFISQLDKKRNAEYDTLAEAGKCILWGMFLKMCIADQLAGYTNAVLGNYQHHSSVSVIIATVMYSFQIYTDFAGYCEMAIGVSSILGVRISENFRRPYLANSVTEFWKRWHISLTKWLTQYVYISLGGNRCSKMKHYWNIMVTFFVSGLWHGANWTFVLWGGVHGLCQVFEKVFHIDKSLTITHTVAKPLLNSLRIVLTFIIVTINWLLFQSESIGCFLGTLKSMFGKTGAIFMPWEKVTMITVFFSLLILITKEIKDELNINLHIFHSNYYGVRLVGVSSLIIYILMFGALDGGNFIYFQF